MNTKTHNTYSTTLLILLLQSPNTTIHNIQYCTALHRNIPHTQNTMVHKDTVDEFELMLCLALRCCNCSCYPFCVIYNGQVGLCCLNLEVFCKAHIVLWLNNTVVQVEYNAE